MRSPHGSPQCMCYFNTWSALDVGRIAQCIFYMGRHSRHMGPMWVTTYGGTCPWFSPSSTRAFEPDMPWSGFEPLPPASQVSTLAKSYLGNLLITILNIYMRPLQSTFCIVSNSFGKKHVLLCFPII
jgi:hypothetical protein